MTIHFTNVNVCSCSLDVKTHSTQSIISDDEVFTGCYSDDCVNHGDNFTDDEVMNHVVFTTLKNVVYRLLRATVKYL